MCQVSKSRPAHGGQIIELGDLVFELSVFETGQPPRFRLHAVGTAEQPDPDLITTEIETVRPDGTRQKFAFEKRDGYLESTADIPEPHEFKLVVAVREKGRRQTTNLQFTEEAHGHAHGGHDGHGDGSPHGHSHGTVDATIFTSERGLSATKWSFIALFITASAQLVVVLISHSVALLADMIHNFGDAMSPPTSVDTSSARITGDQGPTRWRGDGFSPCWRSLTTSAKPYAFGDGARA
jgi:hypothetical protein